MASSWFRLWAAVAPQQFQSVISFRFISKAFAKANVDWAYSEEVPLREHPGSNPISMVNILSWPPLKGSSFFS
jgi:hypothetical protein